MDAEQVRARAAVSAWVLCVLSVALFVLAGAVVFAATHQSAPYAPLRYQSPQTVTSRAFDDGRPSAHLDGTVDVTATKCADSDGPVPVTAVVVWQPVDPRGNTIQVADGAGERPPGCQVLRYENDIPPEIRRVVGAQHARGVRAPLWVIRGAETPIAPDGREGVTEVWSTEPFAIVP